MALGLLGAHRVGKTTLAEAFATQSGFKFIAANLSQAQKILGFDSSNQNYTFKERRVIQDGLLDYLRQLYAEAAANYGNEIIYDRTPLDLIGYTITLANSNVLDEEDEYWLEHFIMECKKVTHCYFDAQVVLVQPGIPLITDNNTSAVAQRGYIEHLNYIYIGLSFEMATFIMPRRMTEIKDRINYLNHVI